MTCCPLSDVDNPAQLFFQKKVKARKEYKCCECDGAIAPGERHDVVVILYNGAWSRHRTCLLCEEIGDHFTCGVGRHIGTLWEELTEYFFPHMRAGGPCMEGLSARAKRFIIDRWLVWKGLEN